MVLKFHRGINFPFKRGVCLVKFWLLNSNQYIFTTFNKNKTEVGCKISIHSGPIGAKENLVGQNVPHLGVPSKPVKRFINIRSRNLNKLDFLDQSNLRVTHFCPRLCLTGTPLSGDIRFRVFVS